MSVFEEEIVEKFHLLEPLAQQRVLQTLAAELQTTFDYQEWWAQVDALQRRMKAHIGEGETVGALSLLDELRSSTSARRK